MFDNLIDLHSHILPHLDDGARNLNQAIAIAQASYDDGIRTIVATPHFYMHKSHHLMTKRLDMLSSVRVALKKQDINIEILPGFEVNATHSLLKRRSLGSLTLAGSPWILLERPYVYGDEFDTVIQSAFDEGLRPLIAHPERYSFFTTDFTALEKLVEKGAWAQITAKSIIGADGMDVQLWCLRAFKIGLAHIVASDAHNINMRAPTMQSAANLLLEHLGEERCFEIFHTNPSRILGRRL